MSNTPDNNRLKTDQSTLLNIEIIVDDDVSYVVDEQRLRDGCTAASSFRGFHQGEIGIRVTTDAVIHQINREYLGHDYPTDVISFPYEASKIRIEGELVVSIDTASERAGDLGWPVEHELLLYVIHGTLHLTGMDDLQPDDRQAMRCAERDVMLQLGVGDIVQYAADVAIGEGKSSDQPTSSKLTSRENVSPESPQKSEDLT